MHPLGAKFLCNDARLDDVGLCTIPTVFAGYGSTVITVLYKKTLPVTQGLAFNTVTPV